MTIQTDNSRKSLLSLKPPHRTRLFMQSAQPTVWKAVLPPVYPNVLTIFSKSDPRSPVLLWSSTYLA